MSRRAAGALAAITAGALALRVVRLGRVPLWVDEGFSYLQVTHQPLADWRLDVHPPLYYGLLWVWAQVSTTDAWLRLPSALLGAATAPAVYALGARLFGRTAGLWAAAYIAVTWTHVWHSRQARMYPLLVLAFALALWGAVTGAREGRAAGWAVYAIAGAAMAWTHGVGVYYAAIVAALAFAIPRPDGARRLDARWLGATAAMALLFAPWAPAAIARNAATARLFWVSQVSLEPPIFTTLYDLTVSLNPPLSRLLRALPGGVPEPVGDWLSGTWVYLVPLLAALAVAVARTEPARRWAVGLLVAAYVAPIALFTAMSLLVRPILIPRILLPVAIPLALLLAAGVCAVPGPRRRAVAGVAVGGVLLLGTLSGLRQEPVLRESWSDAARYVAEAVAPGDVLLFAVTVTETLPDSAAALALSTHEMLLFRYDPGGRLSALPRVATHRVERGCRGDLGPCLDTALGAAGATAGTRIWVIHRGAMFPSPLKSWADLRLEPGPVNGFRKDSMRQVFVEERRFRP